MRKPNETQGAEEIISLSFVKSFWQHDSPSLSERLASTYGGGRRKDRGVRSEIPETLNVQLSLSGKPIDGCSPPKSRHILVEDSQSESIPKSPWKHDSPSLSQRHAMTNGGSRRKYTKPRDDQLGAIHSNIIDRESSLSPRTDDRSIKSIVETQPNVSEVPKAQHWNHDSPSLSERHAMTRGGGRRKNSKPCRDHAHVPDSSTSDRKEGSYYYEISLNTLLNNFRERKLTQSISKPNNNRSDAAQTRTIARRSSAPSVPTVDPPKPTSLLKPIVDYFGIYRKATPSIPVEKIDLKRSEECFDKPSEGNGKTEQSANTPIVLDVPVNVPLLTIPYVNVDEPKETPEHFGQKSNVHVRPIIESTFVTPFVDGRCCPANHDIEVPPDSGSGSDTVDKNEKNSHTYIHTLAKDEVRFLPLTFQDIPSEDVDLYRLRYKFDENYSYARPVEASEKIKDSLRKEIVDRLKKLIINWILEDS